MKATTMAHKVELYGVIGSEWYGKTAAKLVAELRAIAADDDKDVDLHVNSGGGFVDDAVAMYNRLREHAAEHKAQVRVVIDGLAASAATIVVMAGDVVSMPDTATMMIHQPWSFAGGTSGDLRKSADILDMYEDRMVKAYMGKATDLDEAELRSLLAAETWMSAEEAKAHGLVDEVTDGAAEAADLAAAAAVEYQQRAQAHEKLVAYANAPQRFQPTAAPPRMNRPAPMASTKPKAGEPMEPEETDTKPAASPAPTVEAKVDPAKIQAAERQRVLDIQALCNTHNLPEVSAELVTSGATIEQARERVLAALADPQNRPQQRPLIQGGEDQREKRYAAVERALMQRAGLLTNEEARAEYGQNPFVGRSLIYMAETFLDPRGSHGTEYDIAAQVLDAGRHLPAGRVHASTLATPSRNVLAAHTTGDFSNILANVAYKSMLRGWDVAPSTWRAWCNIGTLTNFQQASRVGLNHLPELDKLPEGAEYRGTQLDDRGRTTQLVTYGNFLTVTRQSLVNDDLGAITRKASQFGSAAQRTVDGVVYSTFLGSGGDGPTIDGAALFSGTHTTTENVSATLDSAALATLRKQMRKQKAPALPDGSTHDATLNITPSILLVPAALEQDARVVTAASFISDGTNTISNVNPPLAVVVEGRLDADSEDQFYLIADPNQYDTLEVSFLNGMQQPFLERMPMSNVDGMQFKCRLDVGATVLDYRGFQRGT